MPRLGILVATVLCAGTLGTALVVDLPNVAAALRQLAEALGPWTYALVGGLVVIETTAILGLRPRAPVRTRGPPTLRPWHRPLSRPAGTARQSGVALVRHRARRRPLRRPRPLTHAVPGRRIGETPAERRRLQRRRRDRVVERAHHHRPHVRRRYREPPRRRVQRRARDRGRRRPVVGIAHAAIRARPARLLPSRGRQKSRQRIGGRHSCTTWRGIDELTFGATPTLKPGENPGAERAREDSNL